MDPVRLFNAKLMDPVLVGGADSFRSSCHPGGSPSPTVAVLPVVQPEEPREAEPQFRPESQVDRKVRDLRAVLVALQPPGEAGRTREPQRLPSVQDGDQTHVGGRGQQVWWQVDRPVEKRYIYNPQH